MFIEKSCSFIDSTPAGSNMARRRRVLFLLVHLLSLVLARDGYTRIDFCQ